MIGCLATRANGRVCVAPARFFDRIRGGMVCVEHRPRHLCWGCGWRRIVVGLLCTSCRAEAREEAAGDDAAADMMEDAL